jgi:amino acid adenylation domain-containing protein
MLQLNKPHVYHPAPKLTRALLNNHQTLCGRFLEQVALYPDAPALSCGETGLSYAELDRRSLELARILTAAGAGGERPVAVCAERTPELIVALLAVLRSGSPWLPIDPSLPSARRQFMISDADVPVVLGRAEHDRALAGERVFIALDEPLDDGLPGAEPVAPQPDDLAYIIYTSGSTGKPKGVLCHHRGALNMLDDAQRRRPLGPGDRCSWWTGLGFDVSVYEIFSPLICGAELLPVPDDVRPDPFLLMEWMCEQRITAGYLPPMMIADLEEQVRARPGGIRLRRLLTGVEPIPEQRLQNIARAVPELLIINGYGPTEAAVYCTCYCIDGTGTVARTAPIGRPLDGVELFLFDEAMQPVPDGMAGEIWIGGPQVARGYLNAPHQTAGRFPDTPHGRLYRTGDRAVRLPDGNLMFAGRSDGQFKFNGYRIEPGEIETALCRTDGIREAAVAVREDIPGQRRLIAYYTVQDEAPSLEQLQRRLRDELPPYMVPSLFIRIPRIPMTVNGKTDRDALPPPGPDDLDRLRCAEFKAPETKTQKRIAALFDELLPVSEIGLDDHFFSLGGHSLLATQLASRIWAEFSIRFPLADFCTNATVRKIAERIDAGRCESDSSGEIPRCTDRDWFPLTPAQRTMWLLHQSDRSGTLSNIPEVIYLHGPLQADLLEAAFNDVIRRHNALRMTFSMEGGEVVQRPLESLQIQIPLTDLSSLPAVERDRRCSEIRLANGLHRFDLATGPLLRADLVKRDEDRFELYLNVHHIAADGRGLSLMNQEMAKLYEAYTAGCPSPLPPVERQYSDIACWIQQRIDSGELDGQLDYWKEKLAAPRPDLHFPLDRPRPEIPEHRGARHAFLVSPRLTSALTALGTREKASLFMVLTALWQTLLHRATGSNDVLTGTAIANRNHPQLENVIGTFINALALRTDFSGTPDLAEIIRRVRRTALEAYSNQDIPFGCVMEAVADGTRHPVFRNSIILHNMPLPPDQFGGLTFTDDEIGNDTAKMDLLLYFIERNRQLEGQLEYDAALFDAATAEQLTTDFMMLARQAVKDPHRSLDSYLRADEEHEPTCFVIGEGSLCVRSADVLRSRGMRVLGLISPDTANRRAARERGIPWHHPNEGFEAVLSAQPFDYLFSIVNSYVLKPDVLALPRCAAVNYHDSPLPRYAGVYATAWALINRERLHGISWHLMAEEVDAGDILKQRSVDVLPGDTSITLNARCYDIAVEALNELALELVEGREVRRPQDLSQRTYYPLYRRPARAGLIDWSAPQEEIDALRRALDFGGQPNDLGLPKVLIGGELYVLLTDGSLKTLDGEPSELRYPPVGEAAGWLVNEPEVPELGKKLERVNNELCRHERFWVRRFEQIQPLELPAALNGKTQTIRLDDLPLFLCFLSRLASQDLFTVGCRVETDAPELFAGTVPLQVELNADESLAENRIRAEQALAVCRKRKSFARDLFLRFTHLRRPAYTVVLDDSGARCPDGLRERFRAFSQAAQPEQPLYAQSILTDRDRRDLDRLQQPQPGFDETRCIHQLFEAQAERTPQAVAVEGGGIRWSYAELNARAGRIAAQLQAAGVGPDQPVGLFINRSPELCAALLGILKAGGAYVPLDPDYPPERIEFMLNDTALQRVLTVSSLEARLPDFDGTVLCVDCLDESSAAAQPVTDLCNRHAAYILYTSGSTGTPKGVTVEHRQVVNHCLASIQTYGIHAADRVLQFFSINFDGSVEELFPAWACGATVVLRSDELSSSVFAFETFLEEHKISVADLPTAYWHEWVRNLRSVPPSLRAVIIGGEKVSAELCRVWRQKGGDAARLFNTYGPTECTVVATVHELTGAVDGEIPIGSPIAGTALFVTDPRQQPVPVGLPGELLIGGAGVARGYLNRDDLTAEKFIANPFGAGRLYRTGDLVRRAADGTIDFMGRTDHQVKIRGFRIEPDEVAAALEQHESIAQAVVIARTDLSEQKELAAYYIPEEGASPAVSLLRAFLAENLPDYMVPSALMEMDEFPVTPAGKVDRKALPSPVKTAARERENYVPPSTPQQKILAEIWAAVLGMNEVGIHDNFFDLGGHSLLAIQLVERVLSAGMSLSVAQLFQFPTIELMAAEVGARGDSEHPALVCLREGASGETPFFLLHSAPGDLLGYANLVHNLPARQPVYGFQSLGLVDPERVHSTIPEMAAHYVSVLNKFRPDGPVLLGGWCYGGYVAMEMALQLKAQGRDVRLLALIDAWAYPPVTRRIAFYSRRLRLAKLIGWKHWLSVFGARLRSRLSDENADAVKVLDGMQAREGVLANREEVYRRNREAALKYRSPVYPDCVALFRSDELDESFLPDMAMEWAVLTADQDITLVPGGHRDMLREPSVRTLAAAVQQSIDRAVAGGK